MSEKEFDKSKVIKLKCTLCNRELMNLLPVKDGPTKQKFQASCYFCKGFSQIETIHGVCATGPIGEDELKRETIIEDVRLDDDDKYLFIVKAK
jgi:hypothetical protein